MACRTCSAGFGQLPTRLVTPLRQSVSDTAGSRSSSLRARATTALSITPSTPAPMLLPLATRSSRRDLHTTPSLQETDWKKALLGGVAQVLGSSRSSYFIYGVTERIYKTCAARADYTIEEEDRKAGTLKTTADGEEIGRSKGGPWHNHIDLLPTFSTWAHVTMLHMYLMVVRFRCFDATAQQAWQAQLVNHFFYHAEAKMDEVHGLSSRMVRQRYLKDLFVQWRGLILAYDEGLVKGDAVLAEALWRNLFKAREDVDARALAAVVAWVRVTLRELGDLTDLTTVVMTEAPWPWPSLEMRFATVDQPTAALKTAFERAGITPEA